MEKFNYTYNEANKIINHTDKARAEYCKNISGRKWGDSKYYNFCIDSSMGREKCTKIILDYIKNINSNHINEGKENG